MIVGDFKGGAGTGCLNACPGSKRIHSIGFMVMLMERLALRGLKPVKAKYLLWSVFLLLWSSQSFAQSVSIVTNDYIPLASAKKIDHIGYGSSYDLITAAFKSVGVETTIDVQPVKRATVSFLSRQFKLLAAELTVGKALGIPQEQLSMLPVGFFNISFSYFKSHQNGRTITWNTFSDLSKYRIGCLIGQTKITRLLRDAGLSVETSSHPEHMVQKLYHRRVDLILTLSFTTSFMVNRLYPDAGHDLAHCTKTLYKNRVGLIYWKDDEESARLAGLFKKGWQKIKQDGTFLKILHLYWGRTIPREVFDLYDGAPG